ncbi:MAG: hypothetical protein WC939_03420 [Acholeplasmataceae bacterium]
MRSEIVAKSIKGVHLSHKAWDVINDDSLYISLEGTTGSLKSVTADRKFHKEVYKSPKEHTQFAIIGSTTPVLERTIIDNPLSFYNKHKYIIKDNKRYQVMHYKKSGKGGSRIEWRTPKGIKRIYFAGFDNKARYKQILGMTLYGIWADEIQTAHDDFIGELFTRLARDGGFLVTTSNGGLPDQKIYTDYLNKGRPNPKWAEEIPEPTMNELLTKNPDDRFRFYWFGFDDNPMMEETQIAHLNDTHPPGSFEHNSKILGIRGFVEGLIYAKYLTKEKNMVKFDEVFNNRESKYQFVKYTIGCDVGSTDFTVFTLKGFTPFYKEMVALDKVEINHVGINEIWEVFTKWFDPYYNIIGHKVHGMFIDNAAQIVKSSLAPLLRERYNMQIADSYKFTIKERIDWGIRFMWQGRKLFTERCEETYHAYNNTLYTKDLHKTDIREFPKHIYKDRIDSDEYSETAFIREMLKVS